ncbi:SH3 domain-containing protein [Kordiimonas gwangyangensis]|uniref:SH3 domain-containing protein n=1 Tax=Kordiimonas gwangyangensis TaxID=288022 RepID=UPI0003709C86|nr:SH3 domain-containing protein [Kordiimonas gwangyangensis]
MRRFFAILLLLGISATHATARDIGPSGNPLPRFISLAADKAYMRTGPGLQYPVMWVYSRDNLPLEVIDEHGAWRQVRDFEGVTGWMHVRLLSSKRTAMITGGARKLFHEPDRQTAVRLTADAGVIGAVLECDSHWCLMEIDGTRAWIERRFLWGLYTDEMID